MLNYSKLLQEKFEQEPSFVQHACTATRIMVKRRQLLEAKEALKALKYDVLRHKEEFKLREEALHEKQKQMEESRIQFEEKIQENENKRAKALRRLDKERRSIGVLDAEIELLQNKLNDLRTIEESLRREGENNFRYRDYLLHVVEHLRGTPHEFADIQDILNRYHTLKRVNMDLKKRLHDCKLEYDERQRDLLELSKIKSDEELQHNNEISSLQKRLDDLSISSQRQSTFEEITPTKHVLFNTATVGQVRISVKNLLQRFESYSKRSAPQLRTLENETRTLEEPREDNQALESDLVRLAEYIADYSAIVDEWRIQQPKD